MIDIFSKIYSIKSTDITMKFLNNETFSFHLSEYMKKTYGIKCTMQSKNQNLEIDIKLTGIEQSVKYASHDLETLMKSVTTKIFNNEQNDKQGNCV